MTLVACGDFDPLNLDFGPNYAINVRTVEDGEATVRLGPKTFTSELSESKAAELAAGQVLLDGVALTHTGSSWLDPWSGGDLHELVSDDVVLTLDGEEYALGPAFEPVTVVPSRPPSAWAAGETVDLELFGGEGVWAANIKVDGEFLVWWENDSLIQEGQTASFVVPSGYRPGVIEVTSRRELFPDEPYLNFREDFITVL